MSNWPDGKPDWGSYEDRWGPDEPRPASAYGPDESARDLAIYQRLKRTTSVWTLAAVTVVALATAWWFAIPAAALVTGGICGVVNALLTMRGNERLVDNRHVGGFVLGGFARIAIFGVVPVAFAYYGPWWSMLSYFAGFFLPLALYFALVHRAFASEHQQQ